MANVTIGCRFPTGIVLNLFEPFSQDVIDGVRNGTIKNPPSPNLISQVTLAGQNQRWIELGMLDSAVLRDEDFGTTEVDESFWSAWLAQNPDFPALATNAIFVAKRASEAKAIAKEAAQDSSQSTGMESLDQTAAGITAKD